MPPLSCFIHVGSDGSLEQIKSFMNVDCGHEHGHVKDQRIQSMGNWQGLPLIRVWIFTND